MTKPESEISSTRRVCIIVIPLAIIGLIVGLVVHFVGGSEDVQALIESLPTLSDLDLFRREDPFGDINLNGTYAWPNDGRGLELTLLNALDPDWHSHFDIAVQQWDSGTPDTLTLTTEMVPTDYDCSPQNGYLKICNGDYGQTEWKGINKAYLGNDGLIYASSAKMNEFFIGDPSDSAQRQYTMCHEIGHGLGLPHTDENFANRDQGNCMDYTLRPRRNQQPDERNFLTLAELYGIVGSTAAPTASPWSGGPNNFGNNPPPTNNNGNWNNNRNNENEEEKEEKEKEKEKEDDRRANLRGLQQDKDIPDWVLKASKEIDSLIESSNVHQHKGWRKLHSNEFAEAHAFDIGRGHTIQVHLLRA